MIIGKPLYELLGQRYNNKFPIRRFIDCIVYKQINNKAYLNTERI